MVALASGSDASASRVAKVLQATRVNGLNTATRMGKWGSRCGFTKLRKVWMFKMLFFFLSIDQLPFGFGFLNIRRFSVAESQRVAGCWRRLLLRWGWWHRSPQGSCVRWHDPVGRLADCRYVGGWVKVYLHVSTTSIDLVIFSEYIYLIPSPTMTYHHISSLTYHILRLNIHPSSFTRWMITLLIHCRGPVGHDSQSVLAASARACREEPGF